MRSSLTCLATAFLVSCSPRAATIDTIEIHHSGWVGYNIVIHSNGSGEFQGSPSLPEKGRRAFKLEPAQFERFASAIRPYMRYARPVTDASIRDIIYGNWPKCPPNTPHSYDAGAFYLRWQGPRTNVHYLVDFNCDYDANNARNRRLYNAVHQLPITQFLGPTH